MSAELARFITDTPSALAFFDEELRYVAASAAWTTIFNLGTASVAGRRHGEICGTAITALGDVQRRALSGKAVDDHPIEGESLPIGSRRTFLSGRAQHAADGAVRGVIVTACHAEMGTGTDVANCKADALTGLANRHEFVRRLGEILGNPDPERRGLIAFTVNLDRFRKINNLHGTRLGDQILKITAERLLSGIRSRAAEEAGAPLRSRDIVARLGADEFGIVCGPSLPSIADADDIAHRLLRIIQNPIAVGDLSLRLTASIGFVVTGPTHHDADDVMRDLDVALRYAKTLGPGKIAAWEPALTKQATGQASLAEQLQRAFDNGEFVLHYQPIVSLANNRMVGAEALLRWNHPSEGLVAPAAFLPVLEETGLIVEVGCWVVREAVRQVEAWRMLYGRDIIDWVSINLSSRQFTDPTALLATLREIYDGGWLVHRLKFEVTETTLMRKPEVSRAVLAELQKLGVRVAIDDFGTGYSSLNSLRHYPIETIKIDAEFIAQIGAGEGEKLAQALLDLAGIYGVAIIAEGVETAGQRDFLHERGCGFGQGYLFAEPMACAPFGAYALTHAVRPTANQMPFWLAGQPRQSSDISRSVAGRLSQWGA